MLNLFDMKHILIQGKSFPAAAVVKVAQRSKVYGQQTLIHPVDLSLTNMSPEANSVGPKNMEVWLYHMAWHTRISDRAADRRVASSDSSLLWKNNTYAEIHTIIQSCKSIINHTEKHIREQEKGER